MVNDMSTENIEEYRHKLRHSAAHLLAEAVLKRNNEYLESLEEEKESANDE